MLEVRVQTMETVIPGWSDHEQRIAEQAFHLSYQREIDHLLESMRDKVNALSSIDDVWTFHDYLSGKRHEIEGRYDFRYSSLLFVFASLLKDGILSMDDLAGLADDKLAKIKAMSRM